MSEPSLHIVLYHPEIPPNTGNIGRTCVALGAKLWLIRPLGYEIDNKHLQRAGMDYWEHLNWEAVDDWAELTAKLPGDYWYLSKTAPREYTAASFRRGDVLVFGSESSGLPPELIAAAGSRLLRIPTDARVRSLNLAVAAGIVAYEARRQWSVAAASSAAADAFADAARVK